MNNDSSSTLSSRVNWGPLKIAGLYRLIGGLWILFSDRLAAQITSDPALLTKISLYKCWGYVSVTALLLYWLIRRQNTALRGGEEQLRLITDALPALISYVDADKRYQFNNQDYEDWFGHKAQGKYLEEVLGNAAYQTISGYVDNVLKGETVTYETEIPYKDGGTRFVNAMYVPDRGTNGQVKGFFALVQDITESKQAEEELRQWADAFDGCAHGIAIDDPSTNRITVCNSAFASMHKSRVEDVVGTAILSLYAPPDYEHVRRSIERADQIGHSRFEAHMIRRDGSAFPVQMDVVSVWGTDGDLLHRVATVVDISERKQAEQALRESEQKFSILFEKAAFAIALSRLSDGVIVNVNEAFERVFGYTKQEVVGKTSLELSINPDSESRARILTALKEHGSMSNLELTLRVKSGELRILSVNVDLVNIGDQKYILNVTHDITERKRAEQALRESEERYRIIFELTNDYAYEDRVEPDGTIVPEWITSGVTRLTGYTFVDMKAQDFWQRLVHPEDIPILIQHILHILLGKADTAETRIITKSGELRWLQDSAHPIWDAAQGRVIRIYGAALDISERKQADEKIVYQAYLLENVNDAIIGSDENSVLTFWNHASEKMFGWSAEEVLGRSGWEILKSEFINADRETTLRTLETTGKWQGEALQYRKDGTQVISEIHTIALHDANGSVTGYVSVNRNITERKQVEEALQRARDELEFKVQERTAALSQANTLLQALMDYMPDHIYFKDTESRFIRNSKSQANMLGLSDPNQIVGKTDFDFFPHAMQAYAEEQEVMRSGQPLVDFEEQVVWPDGKETWVSTTKVPLRNPEGQIIGIFGISRDITERKRVEQSVQQLNADLKKQAAQLVAANKELEAFSYSVSHDLRAPLRAIDGFTRILLEDYEPLLDEEGKRVGEIIRREAQHMGKLIDDLLAFSRLGRKEMHFTKIDMKAMASSVFDELMTTENVGRIDFHVHRLPSTAGDPVLIRQVWVNLLSNAIKFSSKKEQAVIEVGSKHSEDEHVYYVRDTGAGFEMEYMDKLFGVFQRLHGEKEFEGTGVGLAIVKRVINRHDGRVWAESEVGKGATFYFALPRKRE
jgi:PAS domain S-box-containing protein